MSSIAALAEFLQQRAPVVVLTGAGISVASGIPTYRDQQGNWQRSRPIQHREFVEQAATRQRYWARSMAGWPYVQQAMPNAAHFALAEMERRGYLKLLITQNVDRLHQHAGHQNVVDLHGRIDRVVCLDCGAALSRADLQDELAVLNADWHQHVIEARPDGDAEVADNIVADMRVPPCAACGGRLMPDVVFFGGTVPAARVQRASEAIAASGGLLVVGSSLTVYSGFRFCRQAAAQSRPIAIVNPGPGRADDLAAVVLRDDAAQALAALVDLCPPRIGALRA